MLKAQNPKSFFRLLIDMPMYLKQTSKTRKISAESNAFQF